MRVDPREVVGPDMDGGFWQPDNALYMPETNMTAIFFVPVPPMSWTDHMLHMHRRLKEREGALLIRMSQLNPSRRMFVLPQPEAYTPPPPPDELKLLRDKRNRNPHAVRRRKSKGRKR